MTCGTLLSWLCMSKKMTKNYFIYILTNWNNKVIYTDVTNNLFRRIFEHKNKLLNGFTKRYNITKLVYYEMTTDINNAIAREKEIKKWRREKKNKLVESTNPEWNDLTKALIDEDPSLLWDDYH